VKQEQIENFRVWFNDYVAGFYGDDKFVNAHLKLKEEHSQRTCKEMTFLAEQLNLSDNQKRIAEVIALFHDVGRFEQFIRYRTYNDTRSVNHSLLGLNILRQKKVLEEVEEKERELIEKAIEYHGLKKLPKDLDGQCLLFSKLIRDADKIDILYVVTGYFRQYKENPEGFKLELDFADEPVYSNEILKKVLHGQLIAYNEMRTLNDMKLCLLGWVYDVNYPAALKRIRQRKFLEMLFDLLPQTGDIEQVKEKILAYVDSKIENEEA